MAGMKSLGQVGVIRNGGQGKVVALAPERTGTAVAVVSKPAPLSEPPPELVAALDTFVRPHIDMGPERALVTVDAQRAAKARLAQVDALLRPATLDEWDDYLFPLCNPMVMANPVDAKVLRDALPFFVPTLGGIPIGCLTQENLHKLVARRFFPKAADLIEVMGPDRARLSKERSALWNILGVKVQPQKPVGQRRAEDELIAWIEEAEQKPVDDRAMSVRACINRLSKAAPALLERHRARLEALLPAQAAQPEAVPQAEDAVEPLPPPTPEVLAARARLAEIARLRQSGRPVADVQREAAKLVKDQG